MAVDIQQLRKDKKDARKRARQLEKALDRVSAVHRYAVRVHFKSLASWAKRKADDLRKNLATTRDRIESLKKRIREAQDTNIPPVVDGGWHPGATRVPYPSSGPFQSGTHKKVVLHTTEGYGLPGYSGSNPHFTIDPKTGKITQHVSITQSSSALMNAAGGVETNHAGAIQIEMIGFASQTPGWSDEMYDNVSDLVAWICKHASIARHSGVQWSTTPHRFAGDAWNGYNGICGHEHVPENDHWDPGAFKIQEIL